MAFERQSLKGPGNIVIQGPEEHLGESRYHWLEKVDKLGFFKKGRKKGKVGVIGQAERMVIRVEKVSGRQKDYDCYSPIVELQFTSRGLLIGLLRSETLKHAELREALNPYRNTIARNAPKFIIGYEHLHRSYKVSYKTGAWGDFLVFEGQPRGKVAQKLPRRLLIVNLWAVFGLAGLDRVQSDGSLYFINKKIGQVQTRKGECLPFFTDVSVVDHSYTNIERIFKDFEERSALYALELMRRDGGIIFDVIGASTLGDRPIYEIDQGIQKAKEAFKDFFPKAK